MVGDGFRELDQIRSSKTVVLHGQLLQFLVEVDDVNEELH